MLEPMIRAITPSEMAELIQSGAVDVVDVRDSREWASGHVPRARHVPLDQLRENPRGALTRDGVVFVCAKGVRSLTAAKVAEKIGLSDVYSLEGGTSGWVRAGLPLER